MIVLLNLREAGAMRVPNPACSEELQKVQKDARAVF
jgi:hypothetical protein